MVRDFSMEALSHDPIHGYIPFISSSNLPDGEVAEREIIDHPWVQRLRHIHQLQTAWWVFPSAEHMRFQHVLGAMHLASRCVESWYDSLCDACPNVPSRAYVECLMRMAALLHDVGRCHQDTTKGAVCHAAQGAQMAAGMVADLPLTEAQRRNVVHCVRAHRFRTEPAPDTIEARVLFDADKLDAIGAVGIARAYQFAGEVGARLHNPHHDISNTRAYTREDTGYREYQVKLRHIRDRMLTDAGRRVAEERHRFMVRFFERFLEEVEGHL